jgi:hypothetical protein
MRSALELLAALCFLVATIWYVITKAWPSAIFALGAFLLALSLTSII